MSDKMREAFEAHYGWDFSDPDCASEAETWNAAWQAALAQPEQRTEAVIDTCDHGHQYAKLPGHPMRDGKPRCPHCMATGLDAARAEQRGEVAGRVVDIDGEKSIGICAAALDRLPVGTPLYTAPPAPAVPDGWRDALIAALAAWAGADEFVAANLNKLGDAITDYPILQGTGSQIRARRIAREPYDGKKAAAALAEIAAMLAAAPEVKP